MVLVACPRCDSPLSQQYPDSEPLCRMCGYVDYSFEPKVQRSSLRSFIRLRYVGSVRELNDVVLNVWFVRDLDSNVGRMAPRAYCPFCARHNSEMQVFGAQPSGLAKNRSTRLYCDEGHRVSILPPDDPVAWR